MSLGRSGRPFSESQRVPPVSAASCLLFLSSGSYKRHFLRLHWLSYRSSCVRLEAGNRRLRCVLLLQPLLCYCLQWRAKDLLRYWKLSRVLLGSLSWDRLEVIEVFDRRIWGIISGEVSLSIRLESEATLEVTWSSSHTLIGCCLWVTPSDGKTWQPSLCQYVSNFT